MKKFRLTISLLILTFLLLVGGLIGCTNGDTSLDAATSIQVEETHVYLAPEGDPSVYALKPSVFPLDTASQEVYYRLQDSKDKEYLSVGTDGVLQAKKLKTDEEGNNVDIIVRVVSAVTPTVYVDVTVTIEIVAVERIVFNPETVILEMQSPGIQLNPIFYPSHASVGRNVTYTSENRDIVTVDQDGFARPRGIGQASIWVKTPVQDAFDEPVSGKVTVNVRYAQLNYRMDLISDRSTLNQIVGSSERISLVLSQLDAISDPAPSITWYVNTTVINEVGVKDSKILNYTPSTLPAGEYRIRAVLSNGTQRQELISDVLRVYNPLDVINADIINDNGELRVGDVAQVLVSFGNDKYPPESYRWTVKRPDGKTESIDKERAERDGSTVIGDLNYTFDMSGEYTFTAEAVVKGRLSGIKSSSVTVSVGEAEGVSDLFNLYIDGTKTGESYAPTLNWDPLPYNTTYYAEIRVGGEGGDVYSVDSVNQPSYFGADYLIVPQTAAGFDTDFEVRVKNSRYGWTDWLSYTAGTVTEDLYGYFDEIVGGHNAYIANMEELGSLLNFITVFRPETLLKTGQSDIYEVTLYIPFAYEDLPDDVYRLSEGDVPAKEEVSYVNAYKLVVSAMRTYVESTTFSLGVPAGAVRGENTVYFKFGTAMEPSVTTEYDATADAEYIYTNATFAGAYQGTGEERELSIDKLKRELAVTTTNQLYLAVAEGYKPVPAEGSRAERIYNKAREVLYTVTTDSMNATEKALNIYKWLIHNVVYDYKLAAIGGEDLYANTGFYLEGVFDEGLAVCDGIAKAYSLLLRLDGIPAYKVCGRTYDGVGHAWNKALLDIGWVGADVTWANYKADITEDETTERVELMSSEFFAMTDETLDDYRITYGKYPEATGGGNYAYEGIIGLEYDLITDSDEELLYQIANYLAAYASANGDCWVELLLGEEYVESKGGSAGGAYEAINRLINEYAGDYDVAAYRNGNTVYVRLIRR